MAAVACTLNRSAPSSPNRSLDRSPDRTPQRSVYPHQFEGSFADFKERQLVFQLTRQLAEAQFARGDRRRSERLWQEAAAEGMDPERIIALLYGVDDHDDSTELEVLDRPYRERARQALRRARSPLARLARLW